MQLKFLASLDFPITKINGFFAKLIEKRKRRAKGMSSKDSITFSVDVAPTFNQLFDESTAIYVSGDHSSLGKWTPSAALILGKAQNSETQWSTTILAPENLNEIRYRYFIGRRMSASPLLLHVLKWETHPIPRFFERNLKTPIIDEFGKIDGKTMINDGWFSDPRLSEIRFSLFDPLSIEFSKPNGSLAPCAYRILLKAYEKKDGNDKPTIDPNSLVFASIVNNGTRHGYRKQTWDDQSGEFYSADGGDFLSFRVQTANSIDKMIFTFQVADVESKSIIATGDVKLLSREETQGSVSVDLMDSNNKHVGKLTVRFLMIFPSTNTVLQWSTFEKTFVDYWKRRPPLDIGHRGMGNSNTKIAKERENTLKSVVMAFEMGCDFVEMDVQLSKDEVPILFHDFQICVEESGGLKEISFKELTLKQLQTYNLHHAYEVEKPNEDRSRFIPMVDNKHNEDPTRHAFPLLKDIFDSVPLPCGFNLEIKYPMYYKNGGHECKEFFELNLFLDRILDVVVKYAKGRRVAFSSFCPDTCILLKAKQNRYPVFFLTQGVTQRYPAYFSPLTATPEIAIAFALNEGFMGVSFHSEDLLRKPELIETARNRGLVNLVWGDDLDETKTIQLMKRMGLDGVIYDRIDDHYPHKQNVFVKESLAK